MAVLHHAKSKENTSVEMAQEPRRQNAFTLLKISS